MWARPSSSTHSDTLISAYTQHAMNMVKAKQILIIGDCLELALF